MTAAEFNDEAATAEEKKTLRDAVLEGLEEKGKGKDCWLWYENFTLNTLLVYHFDSSQLDLYKLKSKHLLIVDFIYRPVTHFL